MPVTPLLSRFAKRRRFLGRALLVTLGIVLALALDFSPVVPEAKPPIAEQAQRVRVLPVEVSLDAVAEFPQPPELPTTAGTSWQVVVR